MTIYSVTSKVCWRHVLQDDLSLVFYPSAYKYIIKNQEVFQRDFRWEIIPATVDNLRSDFFPLYIKEIMSRDNYHLDDSILQSMEQRVSDSSNEYKLIRVMDCRGEVLGGLIFRVSGGVLRIALRVFKKNILTANQKKIMVSLMIEKVIQDYAKQQANVQILSHGCDTHPYIGQSLGLALFKLKAGILPFIRATDQSSIQTIDPLTFFNHREAVLFFHSPSDDSFYRKCYLHFFRDNVNGDMIKEILAVLQWDKIEAQCVELG